ncbi:FANCI solenoid 4-domain-containing protein [Dichotomocladium elegans]|nr:FANCI solenoid 4-domain-containing protein [Dichotomocladium elegans]
MATPLRLDICVENALNGGFPRLLEPVHVLVANMLRSLRQLFSAENNPVVSELLSQCQEDVTSLIFRLKKSDLEDYQLDKSSEFDMATHLGMRNHMYAVLLQGCYEAVIEHVYIVGGETAESLQTILDLFRKRCEVAALLKDNTSGRKAAGQSEQSVLSLSYLTKINRHLFIRNNVHAPIRILRTDLTFVQYIVASTSSLLRTRITQSTFDDGDFRRCVELGKAFLHVLITEDSDSSLISHQPKKGHSVLGSIIDSLRTVNETVVHLWPDRVIEYMEGLGGGASGSTDNAVLGTLSIFMDTVSKYLGDRTPLYKEAANMMQLLMTSCNQLDRYSDSFVDQTKRVIRWLDGLSKERPIEDVALAREIVSLLVHLCSETADFITITYLAQDLHALHGDLEVTYDSDEEEEPEDPLPQVHYAILNPRTCGACTTQILSFLDHLYEDMTWAIGRLKLMEPGEDNTCAFEREICKRLISYLQITSEFTKAVLLGSHAESLIKVLTKMYKTLMSLAKYKLSRPREISQDFVSVISLASSGVTDKMYKFLTIYGQQHGDLLSTSVSKKSKGKEKQGQYSKEKVSQT